MSSGISLEAREIRAALERLERTKGGRFERTAVPLSEAALVLHVSPPLLAAMIITGEIRVTHVEGRRLVPISEVERLRP